MNEHQAIHELKNVAAFLNDTLRLLKQMQTDYSTRVEEDGWYEEVLEIMKNIEQDLNNVALVSKEIRDWIPKSMISKVDELDVLIDVSFIAIEAIRSN